DGAAAGRGDLVDAFAIVVGDRHVEGLEVVLELLHRPRADDRAGDPRLLDAPRQGELRKGAPLACGDAGEAFRDIERPLVLEHGRPAVGAVAEPPALRGRAAAGVLAAEEAAGQGLPGD